MNKSLLYDLQAELCKAMAHPLRMEVIDLLRNGEMGFGEIHKATGGVKSNLSQHLSVMTLKGILEVRKKGTSNYYSLVSERVTEACLLMKEMLHERLKREMDAISD